MCTISNLPINVIYLSEVMSYFNQYGILKCYTKIYPSDFMTYDLMFVIMNFLVIYFLVDLLE